MESPEEKSVSGTMARLQKQRQVCGRVAMYSGLMALVAFFAVYWFFSMVVSQGRGDSLLTGAVFVFSVSVAVALLSLGGLLLTRVVVWRQGRRKRTGFD